MKKKLPNLIPPTKSGIKKILLTMKLALIIVFLSVLQVSANVYSQITVNLNEKTKTAEALVPDDQLSLAIGREGQNVRLAAKLTGWRIDIKSKTVKEVPVEKESIESKEELQNVVKEEDKSLIEQKTELQTTSQETTVQEEIEKAAEEFVKTAKVNTSSTSTVALNERPPQQEVETKDQSKSEQIPDNSGTKV